MLNRVSGVVVRDQDGGLSGQYARRGEARRGGAPPPAEPCVLPLTMGEPDGEGGTLSHGTCGGDIAPIIWQKRRLMASLTRATILPGRRGVDLDKILKQCPTCSAVVCQYPCHARGRRTTRALPCLAPGA